MFVKQRILWLKSCLNLYSFSQVGTIPQLVAIEGQSTGYLDASLYFKDLDGDRLRYGLLGPPPGSGRQHVLLIFMQKNEM